MTVIRRDRTKDPSLASEMPSGKHREATGERLYPLLFSPLRIGRLRLPNRVLLSAMTTGFGFQRGSPDGDALAYYAARSRGVAMTTVGFSAVAPEGRVENAIAWLWHEQASEALKPLAEAISAAGAIPAVQLGHGGRQVSPRVIGSQPVAPSPLRPAAHVSTPPRPLSTAEAEELVAAFGNAARRSADAGFAAVEIHGGHGYLIAQFLSEVSNQRSDRFGGTSVAQRSRFGCEVIEAVKTACPELTVTVRLNGSDLTDDGLQPTDAVEAARRFAEAGAEAFVVSAGVYGSFPWTIPLLDDPEGAFLHLAEAVRNSVEVPVAAVGRITTPELAEEALAEGRCDAVALGRALLADPDWVRKSAEGHSAEIRPCIATVEGCAGQLQYGEGISCSVNPEVGREALPPLQPLTDGHASAGGGVLVIGGGPAGMEAARQAAELGHETVLLERRERLGGALLLAASTPALTHFERLVTWYERELQRLGVEVRLNEEGLTEKDYETRSGDCVIVATGALTAPEVLDGYEHLPAWTLEDLLRGEPSTLHTPRPQGPVAVLGGGSRALAAALWCAREGFEVSLLSQTRFGHDTSGLARRAYQGRLAGAEFLRGRARRIVADGVEWEDDKGRINVLAARSLVVAEPVRPYIPAALARMQLRHESEALNGFAEMLRVGDARSPRNIGNAIAEARGAVNEFHAARAGARAG